MINKASKILTIQSNIKEIQKVESFLLDFFLENDIPKIHFKKVFLCISEAVNNSIEHGNKNDLNKNVTISIYKSNSNICVDIEDEGEGFNYDCVKDPTEKKNLLKESGRGIHIIKSFADNLKFNHPGNSIQLKIKCH